MVRTKRVRNNNNYNIIPGQTESPIEDLSSNNNFNIISGTIPPRITSSYKNSLIRTPQKTSTTLVSTPPRNNKINNNFPQNIKINQDFYDYLKKKISFLDEDLLELVIQYSFTSNLTLINEYLNSINNTNINIPSTTNIIYINNNVGKIHRDMAKGLIESIIHATLNYYERNNLTKTIPELIKVIKKNGTLIQIMKKINGQTLQEYILENSSNNNKLLDILKRVAEKLSVLQNNYGFIHGDFHSMNIMISNNQIYFIDFGRSSIIVPTDNGFIILAGYMDDVLTRKRIKENILKYPHLKAVDLFHLFNDISQYDNTNIRNFMNYIKTMYMNRNVRNMENPTNKSVKRQKKGFNQVSQITRTNLFLHLNSPPYSLNYEFLYPENFEKIIIPQ
jgi:hypothetical protein